MFGRLLLAALIAGVAAGLFVSAVQAVRVTPLIYYAETFEAVAPSHKTPATGPAQAAENPAHDQGHGAWAPEDGRERTVFTVMANSLLGIGFGLLLAAAMVFSGRRVDWKRGVLWGLAGFAVFGLAPSLGLPPDPPGVDAGPVVPRQVWWLMTAGFTAAGLWLVVFTGRWHWRALGIGAVIVPHLIGAPHVDVYGGVTPAQIIDDFVIASLVTTALFWLCLGAVTGGVYTRIVGGGEAHG